MFEDIDLTQIPAVLLRSELYRRDKAARGLDQVDEAVTRVKKAQREKDDKTVPVVQRFQADLSAHLRLVREGLIELAASAYDPRLFDPSFLETQPHRDFVAIVMDTAQRLRVVDVVAMSHDSAGFTVNPERDLIAAYLPPRRYWYQELINGELPITLLLAGEAVNQDSLVTYNKPGVLNYSRPNVRNRVNTEKAEQKLRQVATALKPN